MVASTNQETTHYTIDVRH